MRTLSRVVPIALTALALSPVSVPAQVDWLPDRAMQAKDQWVRQHVSRVEPGAAPDAQKPDLADPARRDAPISDRPPFSFRYAGQPSEELLPQWARREETTRLDARRTQRRLSWTDPASGLRVELTMIDYTEHPAVEWLVRLTNTGSADTPLVESVQPLCIELENSTGATLHYALGESNSADSFRPMTEPIGPQPAAPRVIAPGSGCSSNGHMPYFNLDRGADGVVIAIGWAGQWRAEFTQGENGILRAAAGQELTHFVLHPGETVRTPRILLAFWQGEDEFCGNNVLRRLLLAHYTPQRDGQPRFAPICASVTDVAPDGSYEQPHVAVMPLLKPRGIEVFWFDMDPQHWYGEFPVDTGTWEPHPKKLPNGLAPLGKAAHDAGLEFLLWFEPERVHPGTKIDKEHPEWVMRPQGEWSQLFHLHDPTARRWLTDLIDGQITAGGVDWVRWDFNIGPLGFWRRNDPPDRQGITEIEHVEGLYAMWAELQRRHPGLLIDVCAGGGRRLDFETCSYGMPLWHSDLQCGGAHPAADQLQNCALWRWIPMHGCGVYELEPSYAFRSAMTAGNILAAARDGHLATGLPQCEEEVKRTVALYHKLRPYMLGDFYPLCPHEASESAWFAYQFDRPDLGAGVVVVFRREQCAEAETTLTLHAIDPTADYEVTFQDTPSRQTLKGEALAGLKVPVPAAPGSAILYYRRL